MNAQLLLLDEFLQNKAVVIELLRIKSSCSHMDQTVQHYNRIMVFECGHFGCEPPILWSLMDQVKLTCLEFAGVCSEVTIYS